jgi:hypothetical protein
MMDLKRMVLPDLNGGLNIRDLPQKINDGQSPDMLNMWYNNRVLSKRWGQEAVALKNEAGAAVTLGTIYGISELFEGHRVIHAGTKLYRWDEENDTAADLGVTVDDTEGFFCEFNGRLYHNDGMELREISAAYTVSTVTAYKPVVYINCSPSFDANTPNEDFNLIGAGFTVRYNGDGTATDYTLPVKGLDATAVTVVADNAALTEGVHFTVSRALGTVNFAAGTTAHGAPLTGTDNVEITAYKTVAGTKSRILNCRFAIAFGGESTGIVGGTRAFAMGNPNEPRTYWYCDLGSAQGYGFTYWPDTQYEELVQNNESITAAAKQGGELIIFKERSIFAISYSFDGETVYYPVREFNSSVGCDIPKSVQLIDNCLVFANTRDGVMRIVSTENSSEDKVKPISGNINGVPLRPGLLQENNLAAAVSIDYDRKYWLCVGGKVYIWDYEMTPYWNYTDYEQAQRRMAWFLLNNIPAAHWCGGQTLYYGAGNRLVRFKKDNNDFADFGRAIEAYWVSKAMDFGLPDYYKTVQEVVISVKADTNTTIVLSVSSNKKAGGYTKALDLFNFNWNTFNWDNFSWAVIRFARAFKAKCKLKRILYCQIRIDNNEAYTDIGATNIIINYFVNGKVK